MSRKMKPLRLLRYLYWAYVSQPSNERVFFRLLRSHACRNVVEVGVGNGRRAERLLRWLANMHECAASYTGVDLFEAGPTSSPDMSLKSVYRRLKPWACSVRLIPGDSASALQRSANSLLHTDLLIVNQPLEHDHQWSAWFYVPRMLDEKSVVFVRHQALPTGVDRLWKNEPPRRLLKNSDYFRLTLDHVQRLAHWSTTKKRHAA